jgi:hypothetical protein
VGEACSANGKEEVHVYVFGRKPEGNISIGRPKLRWMNTIKVDIVEIGWGYVDWIGLAQDRYSWRALVNSVMKLGVP